MQIKAPKPRFLTHQKGQSTIEFALVLTALMAVTLALGGLATISYNWTVLQYAASEGSRFGSLGQIDEGFESREDSIRSRVESIVESLGLSDVDIAFTDKVGGNTAGAASEYFTMTITRSLAMPAILSVFFSMTQTEGTLPTYDVTARTVIRNEPF